MILKQCPFALEVRVGGKLRSQCIDQGDRQAQGWERLRRFLSRGRTKFQIPRTMRTMRRLVLGIWFLVLPFGEQAQSIQLNRDLQADVSHLRKFVSQTTQLLQRVLNRSFGFRESTRVLKKR